MTPPITLDLQLNKENGGAYIVLLQANIKLQKIRQDWQLLWRTNGYAFFPPGFSRDELTGRFADGKLISHKGNQLLIGFAVNWRRLDSQLQTVAMHS